MNEQHCLVGETIVEIEVSTDGHAIRFTLEGGKEIVARTEGDCCSHTWVNAIDPPALGFPAKVSETRNLDGRREGDGDFGDVIDFYGFEITTDKGVITVDYRNSNNGYYGGSLVWPGEDFYSGVFGQNESNMTDWAPASQYQYNNGDK